MHMLAPVVPQQCPVRGLLITDSKDTGPGVLASGTLVPMAFHLCCQPQRIWVLFLKGGWNLSVLEGSTFIL